MSNTTDTVMHAAHELIVLKTLLKAYFSTEVQYDESPSGAVKRLHLEKAIKALAEKD